MPNNSGAVEQSHDAATETTQQSTSIFDELDEQEQSSTETGEAEEQESDEAEGAETEGDETDWLPSEQLKVFPPEVVARYAKRFGYTPEEIAADERLANALSKMINSDIEIDRRKKAEEEASAEQEESQEEEVSAAEPTPEEAAKAWTELETRLNGFVDQITDRKAAVSFTARLSKADAIKDPEERAVAVTKALTFGMVNVLRDALPAFLDGPNGVLEQRIANYIQNNLPGLSESHTQASLIGTVESIRASNPKYANMPKFGTPEWDAAAQKAADMMPGMETVTFHDEKGRPLPRMEQFKRKTEIFFRLLTNAPGAVASAQAAIDKGKQIERDNRTRKMNAVLGAGHSKGLTQKSTGNDDLFGAPGEVQISGRLIGKQS